MTERPILFSAETRWIKVAASRIGVSADKYAKELNAGKKICGGCLRSLPRRECFGRDSKTFDQRRSRCNECVRKAKADHYKRTAEQSRLKSSRYRKANPEKIRALNAQWRAKFWPALRAEFISAYGGECSCCGEDEPKFLDLDHVNNNGNEHRRMVGNNQQVILHLKRLGWPKGDYQLLCCNCNQGKARNGGICPHQTRRQEIA